MTLSVGAFVKRGFDFVVALTALIICSPLMLVTAIAVKLDSPGPVIFRGPRVGRHGVPFTMFKFRSMTYSEAATDCSVGKNDKRVTKLGFFMRRFKIDELPQLANVVIGDMSIVGPRPELLRYADSLSGKFAPILSVRPGLTDLASLEFSRVEEVLGSDNPDRVYEERVLPKKNLLRLKYVETRTFSGDILIIMETIACVLRSVTLSSGR